MIIDSRVAGIPCKVEVTFYSSGQDAIIRSTPENSQPPFDPEVEYTILDRSGRRAEWLERKATKLDFDRIESDIARAVK